LCEEEMSGASSTNSCIGHRVGKLIVNGSDRDG
jgi:hypothetical protein